MATRGGCGLTSDLVRGRTELIIENALLCQQLIVLQRQAKSPRFRPLDRVILVLLASRVRSWKQALMLVQPETLLGWHRRGCRLVWKAKAARRCVQPRLPEETRTLIIKMATENRLWGAERIRGERLTVGIRVSKRTIQKYMRQARPPHHQGQIWTTFLHNHAHEIWTCDFLQVTDLWSRSIFSFFVLELGSRTGVHTGVTRHPPDDWIAQQRREATPFDKRPRYLIRDTDDKYGPQVARVAATSRIDGLRTPVRAPRANAICERFLGSVRRECLDHVLVFHERHLARLLREYGDYFNQARPHQGIKQAMPAATETPADSSQSSRRIVSLPVLGGLHHDFRCAA